MRYRITRKRLESLCTHLNEITGNPTEAYSKVDGKFSANPGCFHIDGAYGGYALYQICNDAGGCSDTLSIGHVSPRELYDAMHAFLRGISVGRKLEEK